MRNRSIGSPRPSDGYMSAYTRKRSTYEVYRGSILCKMGRLGSYDRLCTASQTLACAQQTGADNPRCPFNRLWSWCNFCGAFGSLVHIQRPGATLFSSARGFRSQSLMHTPWLSQENTQGSTKYVRHIYESILHVQIQISPELQSDYLKTLPT